MKPNLVRILGVLFLVAAIIVAMMLFKRVHTGSPSASRAGIGTPSGGTGPMTAPLNLPTRAATEIHTEWRTSVQRLLAQYDQDQNATAMRDALLRLTVAGEDRERHLALVLALNGVIGNDTKAKEKFAEVRQVFERAN